MRRITQAQQRKIHAMARELGMDDDLLHSYVSMMAQKDSLKALSLTEAIKVIDGMEAKKGYAAGDRISRRQEQYLFILMKKLGWPTLFCNSLEVAPDGEITGFRMRIENSKLSTVKALQSIGFETIAAGDSYNDLGMIQAGKAGFLFRTTEQIKKDYPDIPALEDYDEFLASIKNVLDQR